MPFRIVRNDITKMQVDAIVNPPNQMPTYSAGTDTAIYEAAGREKLLEKRLEIGEIKPGESAITEGFDLPAKYIIHTVGTPWQGGNAGEEKVIRSCYKSVFSLAAEKGAESLAIPLLASGNFGFPKGIALRIALSEIEANTAENDIDVYLVVFDEKAFALSSELYGDIDSYINENYVEEKNRKEYYEPTASFYSAKTEKDELFNSARVSSSLASARDFRKKAAYESCMSLEEAEVPGLKPKAQLKDRRRLEDVVKNLDKTFMELVFSYADAKGLTDVQVQKRANLDRKAFSKLKCGTTKNPSKATALALAIALELNLDDTKDLLSRAGLALSPCSKQDVIVRYFIEKEAYDIYEINVALFEHGEQLLGTQG